LVGVAVNVTASPAHTGFWEATIETLTGSGLATVMVIEFEVAGFPVTQDPRFDVIKHLTTSPFMGIYV